MTRHLVIAAVVEVRHHGVLTTHYANEVLTDLDEYDARRLVAAGRVVAVEDETQDT
jgi:hypothetical protein